MSSFEAHTIHGSRKDSFRDMVISMCNPKQPNETPCRKWTILLPGDNDQISVAGRVQKERVVEEHCYPLWSPDFLKRCKVREDMNRKVKVR